MISFLFTLHKMASTSSGNVKEKSYPKRNRLPSEKAIASRNRITVEKAVQNIVEWVNDVDIADNQESDFDSEESSSEDEDYQHQLPDQDSSDDDEQSTSNVEGTSVSKESMIEVDNQVNKESDEQPAPRKSKRGRTEKCADRQSKNYKIQRHLERSD